MRNESCFFSVMTRVVSGLFSGLVSCLDKFACLVLYALICLRTFSVLHAYVLPCVFCLGLAPLLERRGQLPPRRASHIDSFCLTGHFRGTPPLLASWTTNSHHQDIPQRLLATWLRAEGLTVMVGGQRVPPRWAWGPSVSQTTICAKTPSCRRHNGAPVEPKVIRVPSRRQARALGLIVVRGHLQMAQGPRRTPGLVLPSCV